MIEKEFKDIISNIKNDIRNTQIKTMQHVNENLINLYFRLGKIIFENRKYGNSFIKNVSRELKITFPTMKGFSERNLRNMSLFYEEYADDENWQQLVANLPWGHNIILISKIKDKKIRKIYADATINNCWSRNMLSMQIDMKYHERIANNVNNFKITLPKPGSDLANNIMKDPYVFEFINLKKEYNERELENALLEKIKNVLIELGKGFSFVGNQYKISTKNKDYYIDLLFYHLDLRCYVVVELKVDEFKPEYIGQIGFYVKTVDNTIKKEEDNSTIGLLLCKEKDRISVEWALDAINVPIGVSSYELNKYVSKDILDKLPTEDDINLHINICSKEKSRCDSYE